MRYDLNVWRVKCVVAVLWLGATQHHAPAALPAPVWRPSRDWAEANPEIVARVRRGVQEG